MKLNKKEKDEVKRILRAYLDKIYELSCVDIDNGKCAENPPMQVDIVNRFLDMQFAKHMDKRGKKK